jgi:Mlc titration factor MtfA (ptsG expression regulator)
MADGRLPVKLGSVTASTAADKFLGAIDKVTRLGPYLARSFADLFKVELPKGPIPNAWPAIARRNVPLTHRLSAEELDRLLRIAQLLVRDVPMEGCAGLEVTEEIQVTIAATAALLVLHRAYPKFPRLDRVLVYPDTFVPEEVEMTRSNAIHWDKEAASGQAWIHGIVIISWSDLLKAAASESDGNVVLHEFAHVLDSEDGSFDGRPNTDGASAPKEWERVLQSEFERLNADLDAGRKGAIDEYGAKSRAEFFAVATEAFFVSPMDLKSGAPALYEQLKRYYNQDPAGP